MRIQIPLQNLPLQNLPLQYLSDIHLEKRVPRFPTNIFPAKDIPLFLAGDIGNVRKPNYREFLELASNNWKHVFLVSGNHEYGRAYSEEQFSEVDFQIQTIVNRIGNITFLNRTSTLFDGHLIIGTTLWTHSPCSIVSSKERSQRISVENKRHGLDREFILSQIQEAKRKKVRAIVMTHHLPSYKLIAPRFLNNPRFNGILFRWASHSDDLIQPPVEKWICGHSHIQLETSLNNVKVLINASSGRIQSG